LRTVFLAAVVALLIAPAAASAAAFPIGSGNTPGVAVDGAGTAYIAYNGVETGSPPHFCRLPRGATACDVALTLPIGPNSDTLSRPYVRVAGTRVDVVVHRNGPNSITQYTSSDGGVTFPTSRVAGTHVPFVEMASGPGDTLSVVTNADGRGGLFHNLALSGTQSTTFATLFGGTHPYNGTVGLIDATTPLAIFATGSSLGAFRRYSGAGDLNNDANWTAPVDIGFVDYPRLASGPSGLFLLAGDENFGLFVRRWDGGTFGPRVPVTASGDHSETHLYQDAAGRLHAVYPRGDADGFHVEHAVSDNGVDWQTGSVSVQTDDEPASMRVATAPDHVGVVAWSSRAAGTTQIRVAAIGPGAPGTPAPPPGPPPAQPPVPTPTPEFHKSVVIRPISGTVRIRLAGSNRFIELKSIDDVPLGATIDVKKGRLALSSVPSRTGAVQTTQLYGGWFRVTQPGSITQFALNEALASCGRARASAKKPKSRKLWGDGKGKFRTKGQYSAATVRGTKWLVQDSCAGTLTRVTQGSVLVRAGRRSIVVRAGKRYLARPR
jgi:hypothetical protein